MKRYVDPFLVPWIILSMLVAVPQTARCESVFSLGAAFDFSSGDYGSGTDSEAYTTSLIAGWYPTSRLEMELTIPWLYQSDALTTTSGGVRFGLPGGEEENATDGFPRRGGRGSRLVSDPEKSQSGIGDLLLQVGYIVAHETDRTPEVKVTGLLKFPTADEEKGLGTGEYDLGAGVDLEKWWGSWYLYGRSAAIFQGDNEALGLKDFITWEGGGGYGRERILTLLSVRGATAPSEDSDPLLEGRLSWNLRVGSRGGAQMYLAKGFSDGSPDFGGGWSLFFNF